MGVKRIIIVSLIVIVVLGLLVAVLFQSGADDRFIRSMLPKIENRFKVNISYKDTETALTSLALNQFEVRSSRSDCTFVRAERVVLSVRVGPLFFGDIDITDIRLDGLEILVGDGAGGCDPDAWSTLLASISKRSSVPENADQHHRRPEIQITSGKVRAADAGLEFHIDNYSGRVGDRSEAVIEVDRFSISHQKKHLASGTSVELKYDPDTRRIAAVADGAVFDIPVMGPNLLALLRDLSTVKASWHGVLVPPASAETSRDNPPPRRRGSANPPSLSLTVKHASGKLSDSSTPRRSIAIQRVTADLTVGSGRELVAIAGGQLPGTDARFVLRAQKKPAGTLSASLEIPDMSMAQLGPMVFPSEHIDWQHASLDGKVEATVEKDSENIQLTGQAVFSDLSMQHEKLASTPIHNLVFDTDFKVEYLPSEHRLHLERFLISRNLARATLRGDIMLDRLAFDLYVNLPKTACKHIKAALPDAFKTRIATTVFDGHIAFDMHLGIDIEKPEEVVLEANIDNQCRISNFGELPEPGYFHGPFAYITYDENGEPLRLVSGPGTDRWVPLSEISPYLIDAVLTTEDGKFWRHNGITLPEIRRAIELNLKKGSLKHGASTITMQLAKNLFLGRERTVARKLQEIILVWYLESYFTKEEILELYFNIIEYGPSIYGIKDAAMHFFGRTPGDLNLLESVFLIKLLPAPVPRYKIYEKGTVGSRQMAVIHRVINTMRDRNRISDAEMQEALSGEIVFFQQGTPLPPPRGSLKRDAFRADKSAPAEDIIPSPNEDDMMMHDL